MTTFTSGLLGWDRTTSTSGLLGWDRPTSTSGLIGNVVLPTSGLIGNVVLPTSGLWVLPYLRVMGPPSPHLAVPHLPALLAVVYGSTVLYLTFAP